MGKLTALAIKRLAKPGWHGDGDGLYLQVGDSGGKSWLFRYQRDGKARGMGLGALVDVSLAEARERAAEARKLLRAGIDPIDQRRAFTEARRAASVKAQTFKEVADRFIEDNRAGWRNPKHAAQWESTLAAYAHPVIGKKPVADVGVDDVLRVLKQPVGDEGDLWSCRPETASRLRGRLEAVLDAAVAMQLRPAGMNPASWKGNLKSLLPPSAKMKRAAGQRSQPALPWQQMPAFLAALAEQEGIAARALAFAVLTAARSGEVRGMTWGEVDLGTALWIVPSERMKAGKLHRQPLSPDAVSILRALPRLTDDPGTLVFPGTMKRDGRVMPLSDMTLSAVVRRMNSAEGGPVWLDQLGQPVVPHGFRSTFRDWVSEATAFPGDIAEAQLAHTLRNKVEAAYSRSDHLDKRRRLMESWAKFCSEVKVPADNVRALRSA